jgi:hypothetical protein
MTIADSILLVRLFSAIFLVLVGGLFMLSDAVTMSRFLGAIFASIGLTALYLVWLGGRSR